MDEPTPNAADLARTLKLVKLALGGVAALLVVNVAVLYAVVVLVVDAPTRVEGLDLLPNERAASTTTDTRGEMRAFFKRMTDLLDRAARTHGTNPADVVPTPAEIDAAVETRTMHSEASQAVMQKLREGFDDFDLTWPNVIPEK